MAQPRAKTSGKRTVNKNGFVERFFRVAPTRNAAFISKLFTMVDDESTKELITWTGSGDQFTVFNNTVFSRVVLPHYFKHCNWSSFVRQLNMYDFHKVNDPNHEDELNPSDVSTQRWDFKHPWFNKSGYDRLHKIRRKPPRNRLIPQIRYSSAMEILPSNSPDYQVSETFPLESNTSPAQFNYNDHGNSSENNQHQTYTQQGHEIPAINETLSQLQSTTVILKSKLESTSNEVQYLRKVTENQQEVLNDLQAFVEYLKTKNNLTNPTMERRARKPKKIHELLGVESDDSTTEYRQYLPPQEQQHYHEGNSSGENNRSSSNSRVNQDSESRSQGESLRSKRRYDTVEK